MTPAAGILGPAMQSAAKPLPSIRVCAAIKGDCHIRACENVPKMSHSPKLLCAVNVGGCFWKIADTLIVARRQELFMVGLNRL
jgi:hypothetical protein